MQVKTHILSNKFWENFKFFIIYMHYIFVLITFYRVIYKLWLNVELQKVQYLFK